MLLAVTAACSAGSGPSNGTPTSGAAGSGDTSLTVGLVAEPVSLDFTTKDGAAIPQALLDNVYETLVKVDQSGELKPALATAWKVSADNKTYTFDLVDNAKFTNGTHLHGEGRRLLHQPGQDRLDGLAQGRHGRRRRRQGRQRHAAAGDAQQAEQRLALQDVHPHRRDDDREGRRRPREQAGRHRALRVRRVEARRLDRPQGATPTTGAPSRSSRTSPSSTSRTPRRSTTRC